MSNQEYAFLAAAALFLAYPFKRFWGKIQETLFIAISLVTFGYPLRIVAQSVITIPEVMVPKLDKSPVFQVLIPGLSGILPNEYRDTMDRITDIYVKSISPDGERELEDMLQGLEKKYFS